MPRSLPAHGLVLIVLAMLAGCRTTTKVVGIPVGVPVVQDRPVVASDTALVALLQQYVDRADSYPRRFDVVERITAEGDTLTSVLFRQPADPDEQARIISYELAWMRLYIDDVVVWMRSRLR